MVACVVLPEDKGEPSSGVKPRDVFSSRGFFWFLTLRSMKSEIRPGFVISRSTSLSPVSILTTVDIEGRSFGLSCVHRRPTLKNLHASSASKSSFREVSTILTISLRSYSVHVCKARIQCVLLVDHISCSLSLLQDTVASTQKSIMD